MTRPPDRDLSRHPLTPEEVSEIAYLSIGLLPPDACPKCFMIEYGLTVAGVESQLFTWETAAGVTSWDIEAATEATRLPDGTQRIDCWVTAETFATLPDCTEIDPRHLVCLAARVDRLTREGTPAADAALRHLLRPVLLLKGRSSWDAPGDLVIDGSHRSVLISRIGRDVPATVLTRAEADAATAFRDLNFRDPEAFEAAGRIMDRKLTRAIADRPVTRDALASVVRKLSPPGRVVMAVHLYKIGLGSLAV